jgi:hypothetical protein
MGSSSTTISKSEKKSSLIMGRLFVSWLPIILVGIVLYWISGGLPPTSWKLLLQVLQRWSALQNIIGGTVFVPFVVLLVQSILILVAWILLGLVIWREIGMFKALQAEQRVTQLRAALALSQNTTSEALASRRNQNLQTIQKEQYQQKLVDEVTAAATVKDTGIQVLDNPFEMDQAVFELEAEPDPSETVDTLDKMDIIDESHTVFVYGNPFDGELPEVFTYDMDLKREVKDMQDNIHSKKLTADAIDEKDKKN